MKKYKVIAAIYSIVLLVGLLGSIIVSPAAFGDAVLGQEGTFPERMEQAMNQHLPFADTLRRWRTALQLFGGASEVDNIFFTEDGLTENLTVSDDTLAAKNLSAITAVSARLSQPTATLMPSACAIRREQLPSAAILFDQQSWLDDAALTLSGSILTVNTYDTLLERGDSHLFYRTDGRPSQFAGYLLYQLLSDSMVYYPLPLSAFSITPIAYDCHGELSARWNGADVRPDVVSVYQAMYEPREYTVTHTAPAGITAAYDTLYPEALAAAGDIDCILGGVSARIDVTALGSEEGSLLLIGDENSLCLIPYLALHYGEITFLDVTLCSDAMLQQVAKESFDRTLLLYGIDSLLNQDLASGLTTLTEALH